MSKNFEIELIIKEETLKLEESNIKSAIIFLCTELALLEPKEEMEFVE